MVVKNFFISAPYPDKAELNHFRGSPFPVQSLLILDFGLQILDLRYSIDLIMKHHSGRHSFIENSFADLPLCLSKAKSNGTLWC
jgi:hypothetical protein